MPLRIQVCLPPCQEGCELQNLLPPVLTCLLSSLTTQFEVVPLQWANAAGSYQTACGFGAKGIPLKGGKCRSESELPLPVTSVCLERAGFPAVCSSGWAASQHSIRPLGLGPLISHLRRAAQGCVRRGLSAVWRWRLGRRKPQSW